MSEIVPLRRTRGMDRAFSIGSDVEIATAMLEDLRAETSSDIVFARGDFHAYDAERGVWVAVNRHRMERLVHEFDGATIGKRTLRVNQSTVTGALHRAAAITSDPSFFDDAPNGVAFSDSFVQISEHGLFAEPNSAEHRATMALSFAFASGAKGCDRFLRALDEIFAHDDDKTEKIRLLQQFVGAALIGVATRYQLALVLFGAGANGKSVLLEIFGALLPSIAVASIPPQELGQEYRRAMLAGVRLNIVNELPEREVLDSEAFKSVITGDLITGRRIREAPFSFRPIAAHLFAGNRLPGTADQSHGFWRRLVPVQFTRTFGPHEQDAGLAGRIVKDELAGVARWALQGAIDVLRTGGYTVPASVIAAREEWRRNADAVRMFAEERLLKSEHVETASQIVYDAFVQWAGRNGHRPMASNKFAERVELVGFTRRRTRSGVMWAAELVVGGVA